MKSPNRKYITSQKMDILPFLKSHHGILHAECCSRKVHLTFWRAFNKTEIQILEILEKDLFSQIL